MTTSPAPKRAALGQGLGALLPPSPKSEAAVGAAREISITQLVPNKDQPRKHFEPGALAELAQSLKESGMIQPIWSPAHIEALPDVTQRFQGHHSISPTIESQKYSTLPSHHHSSPTHYGYSSVCYSNVDYLSGNHQQPIVR